MENGITINALYGYYYNYAIALYSHTTTKQLDRLTDSLEDGFLNGGLNKQQRQRLSNNIFKLARRRAKRDLNK